MKRLTTLFLLVCILAFGTSCSEKSARGTETERDNAEPIRQEVTVDMRDFTYVNMPDTLSSGLTTFRTNNEGIFPHNAVFVKIEEGYSYDDLLSHIEQHAYNFPDWVKTIGGPSAPLSGGYSEVTMDLTPGDYAVLCVVPVPAEEPHFMKGMTQAFTVTEGELPSEEEPQADITMILNDYSFTLDKEIKSGYHTIRVENAADQPHEFLLVKLNDGKSAKDMIGWLGQAIHAESGPLPDAPGILLNGVSPLDKGVYNYISVFFEPGNYALICPYPDAADGSPHFVHGMTQEFTVAEDE